MHSTNDSSWVSAALSAAASARVAVYGDFCLDVYLQIDPSPPPKSIETGQAVHRVLSQRRSLGGAGNVLANLAALGAKSVQAIGAIGDDANGHEIRSLISGIGGCTKGLITLPPPWQSLSYTKPYLNGVELNRLDTGGFNAMPSAAVAQLIDHLSAAAMTCDAIIINQQVLAGPDSAAIVAAINGLIASHPKTRFIVDARDTAALFDGAILKLNAHEAARVLGEPRPIDEAITVEDAKQFAHRLQRKTGQPVFLTRGERGMLVADVGGVDEIPGVQITGRTDPVGAGDTAVAAIAAVLGGGGDLLAAGQLANVAASITVRKIQQTGTATPAEIRTASADPDYVYHPDLALNPRKARRIAETDFELISPLPSDIHIRHAIFDHDGTLSTLREGWELIMQPMMERAVLGPRFIDADPTTYAMVQQAVRTFIDQTTGIQTLVQMQGLCALVREHGFVAAADVLDEHGYKHIYNVALLDMVKGRIDKLQRGELSPIDFQIKNAAPLLKHLYDRGVKLYLASGTDEADVIAEAKAMGYADLFEGRIFGAVGDVNVEAKKMVLERIIRENNLAGHEFAVFGDGPVEMREARKRGGIAIGICSDEVRRFGFNPAKRSRLIRGGASLLIPDFSQLDALLRLLKLS